MVMVIIRAQLAEHFYHELLDKKKKKSLSVFINLYLYVYNLTNTVFSVDSTGASGLQGESDGGAKWVVSTGGQVSQAQVVPQPEDSPTNDPGKTRLRRVACTCPNCKEGDRGGENKKKVHICHIPGCNKMYGKTSHLRAHLRWHSGERPFICSWLFCNKRFTRSDELQVRD